MKPKKILKRIIDSRSNKKSSKKVRKNNKAFWDNLPDRSYDEPMKPVVEDVVAVTDEDKGKLLKDIKAAIEEGNTDWDDKIATSKPVKSVTITRYTILFNENTNPYEFLTSKDVNLEAVKCIDASCVIKATDSTETSED